ncbi:hypothetical protein HF1_12330 [Mycoplasma haemofelis str. Langford 1]|uniref:Uncharacterized protein n=1 Tax=Mycoplasma haemofelis (strain Langford 1) TaxID=941640 RepID=E8ZJC0_MYCHL|nr:hypothetical protein [Mycoplasma haemofelis]CBY93241.1 hypothetical protein HF1_12330 [Mycoplasma haemofelis str. Langford 1]
MDNSLALKSLLGLGGVSAATGAAIGIPKLLGDKEELVSTLLKNKNPEKRLISSKEVGDASWKKAWEIYRKDNKNASKGKDTFQLSDWTGSISTNITDSDNATQSFLNACSSHSSKKTLFDSQLYKDVLKYCTRDTLISDLVSDLGKTALSKSSKNADSAEWKGAWERYRAINKNLQEDIWKLSEFSSKKDQDDQSALEDLRTKCETHLNSKEISNKVFLGQVVDWCTVEGK